jgi:hypothetical protein
VFPSGIGSWGCQSDWFGQYALTACVEMQLGVIGNEGKW